MKVDYNPDEQMWYLVDDKGHSISKYYYTWQEANSELRRLLFGTDEDDD